jgi:hypothetical protein
MVLVVYSIDHAIGESGLVVVPTLQLGCWCGMTVAWERSHVYIQDKIFHQLSSRHFTVTVAMKKNVTL